MFVSLDKITIPVAEEFNVRTGKAQVSGICLTNDHLWGHPNLRSGIILLLLLLLLLWLEREESNT